MQDSSRAIRAVSTEPVQLLNERRVAEMLGMSVASLRRWRLLQKGPRFIKLGSAVRYKPDDISAWLASRPRGGGQ